MRCRVLVTSILCGSLLAGLASAARYYEETSVSWYSEDGDESHPSRHDLITVSSRDYSLGIELCLLYINNAWHRPNTGKVRVEITIDRFDEETGLETTEVVRDTIRIRRNRVSECYRFEKSLQKGDVIAQTLRFRNIPETVTRLPWFGIRSSISALRLTPGSSDLALAPQ